ncbi:MAG: twin-arginine translocase TatA/TatE family subunit [Pseudomonadota bacterium]
MGFGTLEFVLIFTIMLVVLGPERMAEVARKMGHFIGYAKRMSRNFQVQLEDELELKKIRDSLPTRVDLKSELGIDQLERDVKELSRPITPTPGTTAAAAAASAKEDAADDAGETTPGSSHADAGEADADVNDSSTSSGTAAATDTTSERAVDAADNTSLTDQETSDAIPVPPDAKADSLKDTAQQ